MVLSLEGDARPQKAPEPLPEPTAKPTSEPPPSAAAPVPRRNLFEYGVEPAPGPARDLAPPEGATLEGWEPAETAPSRARVVGLLHRGSTPLVALSIAGEVFVLAPGEAAEGFTVLALDEEEGVRLAGPEGEQTLAWPE